MRLSFGEWLPDLPVHENPGNSLAKNCIPQVASYRSLPSLSSFTTALGSVCLGSTWAIAEDATLFNFAGDVNNLYLLDSGRTWTAASRMGGYAASRWDFAQFGDRIICTDISTAPQYFDMNVSTQFANLPNAPNANHVAVVRDFVVLGDVQDGTRRSGRVQWSGFNNSEQWGSSIQRQSGSQDLKNRGGAVQRIIGGDVGIVFQENSITRMTYVGSPVLFRFDEIEQTRGAAASDSVVRVGSKIYYYDNDGFFVLDMYGGESVPIGANRVNRWFAENAASLKISDMVGAVDRENNFVMWAFKSSSSSATNDRVIIYNWQANKWSYGEVDIQYIAEYSTPGLTLDQLTDIFPMGIDSQSIPVDSSAFSGGVIGLLAFNSANEGSTFSGTPLNVCLDTKEFSGMTHTYVEGVRPIVESSGELSITPITRDRLIDTPSIGLPVSINDVGVCDTRTCARYHRYRLTGTSVFDHAVGVEIEPQQRGNR